MRKNFGKIKACSESKTIITLLIFSIIPYNKWTYLKAKLIVKGKSLVAQCKQINKRWKIQEKSSDQTGGLPFMHYLLQEKQINNRRKIYREEDKSLFFF